LLECFHGVIDRSAAGDDDDRKNLVTESNFACQIDPARAGQIEVGHHQVHVLVLQYRQRFLDAPRHDRVDSVRLQHVRKDGDVVRSVVDDEDASTYERHDLPACTVQTAFIRVLHRSGS
jgi:hypothetical protein